MAAISTMRPRYITATRSRDVAHHRQVVGDEQVGQSEPALQLLQQVDDLRLDRDVERRDRLVADDEVGLDRQRPGDADALALAARELVRVAVDRVGIDADDVEQFLDARLAPAARAQLVHEQGLAHDVRRASCARSATRTGPGRSSACGGADDAARRREAWPGRRPRKGRGRRSASRAVGSRVRWSTCRSRTRPRARASRRA